MRARIGSWNHLRMRAFSMSQRDNLPRSAPALTIEKLALTIEKLALTSATLRRHKCQR
jgi:hypothetical protein